MNERERFKNPKVLPAGDTLFHHSIPNTGNAGCLFQVSLIIIREPLIGRLRNRIALDSRSLASGLGLGTASPVSIGIET